MNAKQRLLEARAVMQSDPERAAELLRLVTLESEDEESCSEACAELGVYCYLRGEYREAAQHAEHALARRCASAWVLATSGVVVNAARRGLGLEVDREQLAAASARGESLGEYYTAGLGWSILADESLNAGQCLLSVDVYHRARQAYLRAGAHPAAARIAPSLARAYDGVNEPEQGTRALEQAVADMKLATPSIGGTILARRLESAIQVRRGLRACNDD